MQYHNDVNVPEGTEFLVFAHHTPLNPYWYYKFGNGVPFDWDSLVNGWSSEPSKWTIHQLTQLYKFKVAEGSPLEKKFKNHYNLVGTFTPPKSQAESSTLENENKKELEENTPPHYRTFKYGQRVRKKSGSQWQGMVVGFYSTELTPDGYCVESDTHKGSVQIYPAAALELIPKEVFIGVFNGKSVTVKV